MSDTTFASGTVVTSAWLNDVNDTVYSGAINVKRAPYSAVGDGVTDDTSALNAAFATGRTVYIPEGTYLITSAITLPYTVRIVGESWYTTKIKKSGGGVLFTTGDGAVGGEDIIQIENITLDGTGATAIQGPSGVYTKYISGLRLKNVHFTKDLANGVDANVIYGYYEGCTWGYYGTSAYAGGKHVYLKSAGGLDPNLQYFINCKFFNMAATDTSVTVVGSAVGIQFVGCDWTSLGRAVNISNASQVTFDTCYAEALSHATSAFYFDCASGQQAIQFKNGILRNSTSPAWIGYTTGTQFDFINTNAVLANGTSYFLTNGGVHTIPTNGSITFRNMIISGNTSDPVYALTNGVNPGVLLPRAWVIIDTSGSGTIKASSDPGVTIGRNGTGDVNINFSHQATSTAVLAAVATGQTTYATVSPAAAYAVRVLTFNRSTAAAADDIVTVLIYGK